MVDVLVKKLRRAAERLPVRSLCIGGGVARNQLLRSRLQADPVLQQLHLVLPAPALCSDNGAMIALVGHLQLRAGIVADLALDATATSQTGSKARVRP